jgi:hypothetical protein
MTKPSRSFEKGLEAFSGTSFWVESADSSEKRISASAVTEPSVATEMTRSASPRRIASAPSWIAVAPDAQAVDSVIGQAARADALLQLLRSGCRTGTIGRIPHALPTAAASRSRS